MTKIIKRILSSIFTTTSITAVTSCSFYVSPIDKKYNFNVYEKIEINNNTYFGHQVKFKNFKEGQFKIIDNTKISIINIEDIEYANIEDFLKLINGLIYTDVYLSNLEKTDDYWLFTPYGKSAKDYPFVKFNFKDGFIEFNDNSVFTASINGVDSGTKYNKNIKFVKSEIVKKGNKIMKIKLRDYGFNLFKYKNDLLVPFDILNLLFGSNNYYNLYLGKELLVGNFLPNSLNDNQTPNTLLNNENRYLEETKKTRTINYNFMALVFDYFYGFKDLKMPNGFKTYTKNNLNNLTSTNPNDYLSEYAKLFTIDLNDPHAQIFSTIKDLKPSIDFNALSEKEKNNNKTYNIYKYYKILDRKLQNLDNDIYQKDKRNEINIIHSNDLAIIKVNNFVVASEEMIKNNKEKAYEYDTFYRVLNSIKKIQKDYKDVKNIVLDLSTNTGGHVVQAEKLLGMMTNENIRQYQFDTITNNFSYSEFKIDADDDGDYNDDDAFTEYNWYIMTSPITFSAANFMATYAKDNNIAKIIGNRSSGGTFSVFPFVLPDGTTLGISSNDGFTFKDQTFVEDGAEVDLRINYEDYYNPEKIDKIIHNQKRR
ncbi:hypothetical protein JXZ92_02670 [Mycoplasma sp. CSL10137]|uniref:S41 family peptidase n=1 Tax=Mycoplasma sp. CSL10137 TaxID=2813824 RepID=UPI00197BE8C1|nr:S41 family peptidase [Mycoplasma sp. CSL10137]MBN4083713.1 hypothetical protein [Mycoplasma sp. CSL10137]